MSDKLQKIARSYFDALKFQDFKTLRSLMDDNMTFTGPLAKCSNAEESMKGLQGLSSISSDIKIKHIWADDSDVITWYELYTTQITEPLIVCNWMHIIAGKIVSMKVTFDPRPLLGK